MHDAYPGDLSPKPTIFLQQQPQKIQTVNNNLFKFLYYYFQDSSFIELIMCIVDVDNKTLLGIREKENALQLVAMRKAIPQEAFVKSLFWSLCYMFFDYAMWLGSIYGIYTLNNSSLWGVMPLWLQVTASILFWTVAGFFMWCMFVVGHDCGHTNFSNYTLLNDIIGHITHGSLLVPYYPWQMSHHRHHSYHNHVDKDYSHPWYTPERIDAPDAEMARLMHDNLLLTLTFPLYGWSLYLYGMPDGSHYFPFSTQRLWKEATATERTKCFISTSVVLFYLISIYTVCGSLSAFAYYYLVPYIVMGWWLVTVTYLQHHSPDTLVYNDADWKFVDSAFETVDRKFGFGIDTLSHHITDGHVAHHLFFTKIPHYNLPIATKAIRKYLKEHNLSHMYKYEKTYDFAYRVHKYFVTYGFKSEIASKEMIAERKKCK